MTATAGPHHDRSAALHLEVLGWEYAALKAEQDRRSDARDKTFYLTMLVIGGVVAAVLQSRATALLLALPPACVVLGWVYLVNDRKVSAIGDYIREHLAPTVGLHTGTPVFGWESAHRSDRHRRLRKRLQLCVDLAMFTGPGVAAVASWLVVTDRLWPGVLAAACDAAVVAVLAWQIVLYADLRAE